MARSEARRGVAFGVAAAVVAAVAVTLAILVSGRPPDGPVAVDWDGTRCARCGMLVSEAAFAAQLHLRDGSVRHFDDPGCLLLDQAEREAAEVHAVWLHHHEQDRWLPLSRSAFVRVPHSPMGYGLGTVAVGESPDAIGVEAARELLAESLSGAETLAREREAGGAP